MDETIMENRGIDYQFRKILSILNIFDKEFVNYRLDITAISVEQINDIIILAPDFYDANASIDSGIINKDFVDFINLHPQFMLEAYLIEPNSDDPKLQINGMKAPCTTDNIDLMNNFLSNYRDSINPPDINGIEEGFIRIHWN